MQVEGINESVSAAEVVELRAMISVMREALGEAEHQRAVAVQQALTAAHEIAQFLGVSSNPGRFSQAQAH
jgi:hypothetical protein